MACKVCASENVQKMHGELTATFPSTEAIKIDPVYVCEELLVCLDCGRAEIQISPKELRLLKKGRAEHPILFHR